MTDEPKSHNPLGLEASNWARESRSLPLSEVALRASIYKWYESRAFELFGSAVLKVAEGDLKLMLNRHSLHYGWHAELWHNHIPETPAYNPTKQALAPGQAHETLVEVLADTLESVSTSALKLVGLYRVLLPYQITSYQSYLRSVSPVSEAAIERSLKLILRDKIEDWQEGEAALQRLVVNRDELALMADKQLEVETILLDAGGLVPSQRLSF